MPIPKASRPTTPSSRSRQSLEEGIALILARLGDEPSAVTGLRRRCMGGPCARLAQILAQAGGLTAQSDLPKPFPATPGQGLEPQSPGPEPGVTANWTIPDRRLGAKDSQTVPPPTAAA